MRLLHFLLLNRPRLISVLGLLMLSTVVWFTLPLLAGGIDPFLTGRVARSIVIATLWLIALLIAYMAWRRAQSASIRLVDGLFAGADNEPGNPNAAKPLGREAAFELLCSSEREHPSRPSPWYFVVGGEDVGKSSLIRNSMLLATRYSGSGITSNFDWWINSQGAPMLEVTVPALPGLLTPDGRAADADSSHKAEALRRVVAKADWEQMLARLHRNRPAPAINGVLLVLDSTDINRMTRQGLRDYGVAWRERLADLQSRLEVSVPCYVVVTHMDRVEGFVDCFMGLSAQRREQVFGLSLRTSRRWLPMRVQRPAELDVERQLLALKRTVGSLCWHHLSTTVPPAARYRVFEFPSRYVDLCDRVQKVLGGLLNPEGDGPGVSLRGVYFSSVIPAGSAEAARSFFVAGIFNRMVLPDFGLAQGTATWRRMVAMLQFWGWPLLAAASFSLLVYWGTGLLSLRQQTDDISGRLRQFTHWAEDVERGAQVSLPAMTAALSSLRQAGLESIGGQLSGVERARMQGALRRAYGRAIQRYMWPIVREQMEAQLNAVWTAPDSLRKTLSLYQSLASDEALPKADLKEWLRLNLATAELAGEGPQGLAELIEVLLAAPHHSQEINSTVVQNALQRLAGLDAGRLQQK